MDTNPENQTFEEWVKNPPKKYRKVFQEIENLQKEYIEEKRVVYPNEWL
jgi:ribosomal 50S subunit-associated protein YjgA (DUF615 family)